jgi:hypothetical protein
VLCLIVAEGFRKMHEPPLASASPRLPMSRPRPIPQGVKAACQAMVYDGVGFIEAAKANGLKPTTMRRWLHRPELVALLRRERAAFRAALCCANERVLAEIRDEVAGNQMARVSAIRALETLDEGAAARLPGDEPAAVRITILSQVAVMPPAASTGPVQPAFAIDVTPAPAAADPRRDRQGRLLDERG